MKNLVSLLREMRAEPSFGQSFGISVTLAPDIYYLQHFDAKGLIKYATFLGFMSYDLHGTWDGALANVGKKVYGQADGHDIERDLMPMWFDLSPTDMQKVNVGNFVISIVIDASVLKQLVRSLKLRSWVYIG